MGERRPCEARNEIPRQALRSRLHCIRSAVQVVPQRQGVDEVTAG